MAEQLKLFGTELITCHECGALVPTLAVLRETCADSQGNHTVSGASYFALYRQAYGWIS